MSFGLVFVISTFLFHNLTCSTHQNIDMYSKIVVSQIKMKKKHLLHRTQMTCLVSFGSSFVISTFLFHNLTCSAHKNLDMYSKIVVSLKKNEEKNTLTTQGPNDISAVASFGPVFVISIFSFPQPNPQHRLEPKYTVQLGHYGDGH